MDIFIEVRGERLYTYRYTVTTRMTSALRGSDESHFNVSLTVRDKATRQCPQTTTFEVKGEPKQIRTEVPQPTALPLGQTGSQSRNNTKPSFCKNTHPRVEADVIETPRLVSSPRSHLNCHSILNSLYFWGTLADNLLSVWNFDCFIFFTSSFLMYFLLVNYFVHFLCHPTLKAVSIIQASNCV